jgi:F0F1-type ATP synthase assembly protein I
VSRSLAVSLVLNGLLVGIIAGYVVDRYVLHDCQDCSFQMSE